jgi:hypothetical protein
VSLNAPLQRVPYGFRPVLSVNAWFRQSAFRLESGTYSATPNVTNTSRGGLSSQTTMGCRLIATGHVPIAPLAIQTSAFRERVWTSTRNLSICLCFAATTYRIKYGRAVEVSWGALSPVNSSESATRSFQSNWPGQKCSHCFAASLIFAVAGSKEPQRRLGTNLITTTALHRPMAPINNVFFNAGFIC